MFRLLIILLLIYALVQLPFVIKAYLKRRKYQAKIKDGRRMNQETMKKHHDDD
ncbi:hypothetical protein LFYK43_01330 [Ligilactobacillus salitolerans]|uniref:Uncharacterized protein n=1 Tax=Ligilactobacillus salitolerans TaxID=1808352 RepID=A0A401IQ95_9LACO|nr:hypothetical protein [Ligilactobacillus salitolerans]GBG93674.1 hypothetical protein LFYK43_01330 [Ligilactobacillus salitolerans]